MRTGVWGVVAAVLLLAGTGRGAQSSPPTPGQGTPVAVEVAVPEGHGAPVITDGLFSPGEWDDARRVALTDAVELRLKQYRGVVNPLEIITATSFPSDGIEFAIRRPKLPGPRWRVRLGASVLAGGKPGWLVHPPDTTARTTDGWLVLRLD